MRPRLKELSWERDGDRLRLVYDPRDQFLLADPDGSVEKLLALLGEGGRTVEELAGVLTVDAADVRAAVSALDAHGLVEDGDRLGGLTPDEAERHFSTLAFLESFGSLDRSHEDLHRRLRESHVLVLGTGGLNSTVIPHLAGLGVGRLTLLDRDQVEPRNFARQYLYRWAHLGARKATQAAEWVRTFDPAVEVDAIDASIEGPDQLAQLVGRLRPDVVAAGVDSPNEIDLWVNRACVQHGVPFVRGGFLVTTGAVWSVDPGVSACRACIPGDPVDLTAYADPDEPTRNAISAMRLHLNRPQRNRGIGPVVGLLGSYAAFEVLRYLTRFEPPAHAGRPLVLDFAHGCAANHPDEWQRDPACTVCGGR
ncbi:MULTISPECIES: HesA/MoeB/ThiF family protein [unclassified Nonomuraea]|uniref:HesA/MoeB/ThiF family protein n=1 Tax=unclassified Nonomuraea TaxID=2593643 RepID=UPI0035C0822D